MTGTELKEEFLLEYDRITSFAAPGYEDSEIYAFLSKAQNAFVKHSYESNDVRPITELIRREEINTSVYPYKITNAKMIRIKKLDSNATYLSLLPSGIDFKYYLTSRSKVTRTYPTITNNWIDNVFVNNPTDANNLAVTEYNRPRFTNPAVFFDNYTNPAKGITDPDSQVLVIVYDYYTSALGAIELHYIKEPDVITTSEECELSMDSQRKVIALAVNDALETIQDPRFQTQGQKPSNV